MHARYPATCWLLRCCVVPYLNQPSARNSSRVAALDTRWMKPWVRRGVTLARTRGLVTTAALGPTGIHLAQDPGFERKARRSRPSSHASGPDVLVPFPVTFREFWFGVFFLFGKVSPSSSAPACGIVAYVLRWHRAARICGQVVASSPSLVQMPPRCPQMLGLLLCDTFPPVTLAYQGQCLSGHSVLRKTCFFPYWESFSPCMQSPATHLALPHLCFITSFLAAGIPVDQAGFILFSLLFVHLLLVFLLRVVGGGMKPQPSPSCLLQFCPWLCRQVLCQAASLEEVGWLPAKFRAQELTYCNSPRSIKVHFYPFLDF